MIDDGNHAYDGKQPLHLPAGWQIADGSQDDIRICGANFWQSNCLVFANGDPYGTSACNNRLKTGRQYGTDDLVNDACGLRTKFSNEDVLLRRRA